METTIADELLCPICTRVPEKEIYQCVNGHVLCHNCFDSVFSCPQCRQSLSGQRIRVRKLESLLNLIKFDCPNKSNGCSDKLARNAISDHLQKCEYSGPRYKLCEMIGYECNYLASSTDKKSVIAHLHTNHSIPTCKHRNGVLLLEGMGNLEGSGSIRWTPVVLNPVGILIAAFDKERCTIGFLFVNLTDNANLTVDLKIKSCRPTKNPPVQWKLFSTQMDQTEEEFSFPFFQFSTEKLVKKYCQNGILHVSFSLSDASVPNESPQYQAIPAQMNVTPPSSFGLRIGSRFNNRPDWGDSYISRTDSPPNEPVRSPSIPALNEPVRSPTIPAPASTYHLVPEELVKYEIQNVIEKKPQSLFNFKDVVLGFMFLLWIAFVLVLDVSNIDKHYYYQLGLITV